MRNTKPNKSVNFDYWARALAFCCIAGLGPVAVHAEIKLSTDMGWRIRGGASPAPSISLEETLLSRAVRDAAASRSATRVREASETLETDMAYRLTLNGEVFYLVPMTFMAQAKKGDMCSVKNWPLSVVSRCDEGQVFAPSCHLGIFDVNFKAVGWHTASVHEKASVFCSADMALGVGKKSSDDLLWSFQYSPVDPSAASKVLGRDLPWQRMTVRLTLHKTIDGRVAIEQDDRCLGNPNHIKTIPDARRALRQCGGVARPSGDTQPTE